MSSPKSSKSIKGNSSVYITGRTLDLFILVSSLVLGMSIGFLSTHIWEVGNTLLSILFNWSQHEWQLLIQSVHHLYWYVWVSFPGIWLEMIAIIVILILLFIFYRRDDGREDKIISILGEIRDAVKSPNGGGNATTESETSKGQADKAKKESKKGGKA